MPEKCAFCTFKTCDEGNLYAHVISHKENAQESVEMVVDGIDYLLTRMREGTYECLKCEAQGKLGGIWAHFVTKHRSAPGSEQPSTKKARINTPPPAPVLPRPTPAPQQVDCANFPLPQHSSNVNGQTSTTPPSSQPSEDSTISDSTTSSSSTATAPCTATPPFYQLNFDQVFVLHLSVEEAFTFIRGCLENVLSICPLHSIMLGAASSGHQEIWKCNAQVLSHKQSEYWAVFTKVLNAEPFTVCYCCWTPMDSIFDHPLGPCVKGSRDEWEDWWRGVPYMVWRTTGLRNVVFPFLQLPTNAFATPHEFAKWLTNPAMDSIDITSDMRMTNMVAVVYAYFVLKCQERIQMPAGGFRLDRIPSINSYNV